MLCHIARHRTIVVIMLLFSILLVHRLLTLDLHCAVLLLCSIMLVLLLSLSLSLSLFYIVYAVCLHRHRVAVLHSYSPSPCALHHVHAA
jgi:hypothetical protein